MSSSVAGSAPPFCACNRFPACAKPSVSAEGGAVDVMGVRINWEMASSVLGFSLASCVKGHRQCYRRTTGPGAADGIRFVGVPRRRETHLSLQVPLQVPIRLLRLNICQILIDGKPEPGGTSTKNIGRREEEGKSADVSSTAARARAVRALRAIHTHQLLRSLHLVLRNRRVCQPLDLLLDRVLLV